MSIIFVAFIVFGITLVLTKSKILGNKREFVDKRYAASKVGGATPSMIHRWWHAMWTCSMCAGFWIAIPICFWYPTYDLFADVIIVFGLNWLLHVMESFLFFTGQIAEQVSEKADMKDF